MRLFLIFALTAGLCFAQTGAGAFGPGTFFTTGNVSVTYENGTVATSGVAIAGKEQLLFGDDGGIEGGYMELNGVIFGHHFHIPEIESRYTNDEGSRFYSHTIEVHGYFIRIILQVGWNMSTELPAGENSIGFEITHPEATSPTGFGYGFGPSGPNSWVF